MSDIQTLALNTADDGFEAHYTEKIWALIPEVYRDQDGMTQPPGRLRALVEILAGQAAVARRSVDRLWSDTRVDEADDWAIPYLGALVGARPVHALNRAAQRANLGRTILYRRRQGTVRLSENLADDIADWDAVASEGFLRLIRYWHLLDSAPKAGPITRSPQWGYPDLRTGRLSELLDGPQDDLSHFPDLRMQRGTSGRYGIPKLNLHLFRHYARRLRGVVPRAIADGFYTLDPSGRDVAMYQPGGRPAGSDCSKAREWEMRAPIPCRRLTAASFLPRIQQTPAALANLLMPIYGRRFQSEAGLLEAAEAALGRALSNEEAASLILGAMEEQTPRRNLMHGGNPLTCAVRIALAADAEADGLGPEQLYGANLAAWGIDHSVPGWVKALIDPERGRVRVMQPLPNDQRIHVQRIFYGNVWPVGAGTHNRITRLVETGFTPLQTDSPDLGNLLLSGELRFMDSRTFTPIIPADGVLTANGNLTLSAANGERPFVEITAPGGILTLEAETSDLSLTIDGLWLSILGADNTTLCLKNWARVILRSVTLDPGGVRAAAPAKNAEPIPAVTLMVGSAIGAIEIQNCITGPITDAKREVNPGAVDTIRIGDSITRGIELRNAQLSLERVTVLGGLTTGALQATEVIIDGQVMVEDAQSGCFRFSAAHRGGRRPKAYESHVFTPTLPPGTFRSTRFGDPDFGQLAETAPEQIRRGGEGGTEMGVYSRALDPIKRADLIAKLTEFMPINAIAQLVFET